MAAHLLVPVAAQVSFLLILRLSVDLHLHLQNTITMENSHRSLEKAKEVFEHSLVTLQRGFNLWTDFDLKTW